MLKEIIIITVVIILVIVGNVITQNNTSKSAQILSDELNNFRTNIIKQNDNKKESLIKQIEKIEQVWDEQYEKLAYYIEHEELEKVETEITKLKADIEAENYPFAIENLDNCVFILEHIKDKSALEIVNIF